MEAARFRLIGSTLLRSGNDRDALGAHDANLIFSKIADSKLGAEEKRGLLDAGLQGFDAENIPLWKWAVSQETRSIVDELALRTVQGTERQKVNTFKALTILNLNLRGVTTPISRVELRDIWLGEKSAEPIKVSALRFLGELGDGDDLEHIDRHIDSPEATIAKTALSAKVNFLARISITDALVFLSDREDADVPDVVVEAVEAKLSALETPVLKGCIATRSPKLQLVVVNEMLSRKAFEDSDIDLMAKSNDAEVRLIAAHAKHNGFSRVFALRCA